MRKDEAEKNDALERARVLQSQLQEAENFNKAEEAKKEGYYQKLRNMHDVNRKIEKTRLESERKMESERDMVSLQARLKLQEDQTLKKQHEKLKQYHKYAEIDKMVAVAAKDITNERDYEKDRLANININRKRVQDEHLQLKNHLDREVLKTYSERQLKADRLQMVQRRSNEKAIEKSNDLAQKEFNRKMDQDHWDRVKREEEAKRQQLRNLDRENIEINEQNRRLRNNDSPNLNQDYISNIRQIKGLLAEEIQLKEGFVKTKNTGKRIVGGSNTVQQTQVIGTPDRKDLFKKGTEVM